MKMKTDRDEIHAVIGVRRRGPLTWYARRSMLMSNYKGVWSLPSMKFDPERLTDPTDPQAVGTLFETMASERLGGVPIRVLGHLTSGSSDMNPMGVEVTLHLHEIEMLREPTLNPRYYVESGWMTAEQYQDAAAGQPCGLCTRLWGDHAWLMGYADRPFLARAGGS